MRGKVIEQKNNQKIKKDFLKIKRFFTKDSNHPYDELKWIKTTAEIPGSDFKLENVEFPNFYSQNAINIIASKYFKVNKGKQETSLKELIDRIVKTFKKWGLEQGYFDEKNAKIYEDELTYILLHQYAAFNSPVWFNVGVEGRKQQCSACFILDVEDDMESILDWIKIEGTIFKGGSGSGVNLSKLRAKGEALSTGGASSGVISFMKAADAVAGSIKSGGATRRAAKMVILNVDHPEIIDFIRVKAEEENKVRALMEAGYDMTDLNNPLWQNIFFQNANNSIRVTDEFMKAVLEDKEWTTYFRTTKKPAKTYKAKEILWEAAKAAWECGDPGIQFHDTINRCHTCKNSGEIVATNPCSEYCFLNWTSCFAPETRIATKQGLLPISELYERQQRGEVIYVKTELLSDLCNHKQLAYRPAYIIETGFKPVYKVKLSTGQQIRLTADHLVLTSKGWKQVKDLKVNIDDIKIQTESEEIDFSSVSEEDIKFYQMLGWLIGDGYISEGNAGLVFGPQDKEAAQKLQPIFNSFVKSFSLTYRDVNISCQTKTSVLQIGTKSKPVINELINKLGVKPAKATQKRIPRCVLTAPKPLQIAFLGGLFSADGSCRKFINKKGTVSYYVSLASSSYEFLREVQLLLLDLGIRSYIGWTKFKTVKRNPQGHLNLFGYQAYKFLNLIGFPLAKYKEERLKELINKPYHHNVNKNRRARVISVEPDGIEKVYDVYEPVTHTLIAEGLIVHNCNLASINLMKFLKDDGSFDIEAFKHTIRIIFLSQDILISPADYPHPKIAEETKKYRTIGLGYTNLGALIMALGLPYDSNEARFLAGSLTSLMTAEAYKISTEISEILGPFPEYEKNKEPMLEVMKMHRDESYKVGKNELTKAKLLVAEKILEEANKTWDEVIERGEKFGFRNAQATLLAPTGCLTGNTLISTERGLVPLETLANPLGERWQDLNILVMTDEGEKLATKFFVNGLAETIKIRTKDGYEIIGTPEHRIKVFDKETGELKWKYFADIKNGDIVALEMNTIFGSPQPIELPPLPELHWNQDFQTKVPRHMNEELAEIIGYFMGDGSLHAKGLRFCVYKEDKDVVERLSYLIKNQFNLEIKTTLRTGYIGVSVNSVPLAIWWEACGFSKKPKKEGKGWEPHIPLAILYSNDPKIYKAFLRGLFEADGTVWKDVKVPALSTHSKNFHDQIKSLLLALGFPTKSKIGVSDWGKKNLYVLYIRNREYSFKFKTEIGFIGKRKNDLIDIGRTRQTPRMDRIFISENLVKELVASRSVNKKDRDILRLEFKRGGFVSRYFAKRILNQIENKTLNFYVEKIFFDEIILKENNGEALTYDLSVPENVTYLANGFISHNTISFMMDCDTTGIEPDFALVKMKQLVGGGWMKIVNNTVPLVLKKLGYSEKEIKDIVEHLEETQNIETAPHLKKEHLPIFDTSVPAPGGKRSISLDGHIKMVAAVQPFLSGAISKTFNMPNSATIEDVYNSYIKAWRLGIKCFAIYRDGSKATQALFTTQKKKLKTERRKLPLVRQSETHKFSVAGHEGYLTYSFFEDGSLGEIFIRMSKQGSTLAGLLDAFAISVSIALQHGVPLKELVSKFIYMRFEPMGLTNNDEIPIASSIIDYIFKYLAMRFLSPEELKELGLEVKDKVILKEHPKLIVGSSVQEMEEKSGSLTGPPCKYCGGMTTRTGNCYTCLECGESSGGCS